MKTKIALLFQIILILLLVGCGGGNDSANDAANDNMGDAANYGNNDDVYYGDNDTSDEAAEEPSFDYFQQSPPATAVPIGAQPQTPYTPDEEDYGPDISGYVPTLYDNLSTFGIDVDTASYTRTVNYIEEGRFPPPDSVRVEEFINYFEAGYPSPENVAFGLYADSAPSPFHGPDIHLLRFGVQGYEVAEADRKPLALTFVIDVSGSMNAANKLNLVKQSLRLLVDRLRPDDTVSIVIFGSEADVLLTPTRGDNKRLIKQAIDWLHTAGSTNAEDGLRMGYGMAFEHFNSRGVNRVILCSDGVANVGQTEADQLLRFIEDYAAIGINLTTTGFGMGTFNDSFMEELADKGNGNYAYVNDIDEAQRLFVDDLTSTMQVIAKDAKIQVEFNPEAVSHYRLIGYENRDIADEDFRDDTVDAGELGAGHSVTALYAIRLNPNTDGRIATMQLRWEDPDNGEVIEINGSFNTWDVNDDFFATSPHFQLAVVASQFAEILRGSTFSGDISVSDLLPYMYNAAAQLPGDAQVAELTSLLIQASLITD
jgi:Ca-activated chloride channel family protein